MSSGAFDAGDSPRTPDSLDHNPQDRYKVTLDPWQLSPGGESLTNVLTLEEFEHSLALMPIRPRTISKVMSPSQISAQLGSIDTIPGFSGW